MQDFLDIGFISERPWTVSNTFKTWDNVSHLELYPTCNGNVISIHDFTYAESLTQSEIGGIVSLTHFLNTKCVQVCSMNIW